MSLLHADSTFHPYEDEGHKILWHLALHILEQQSHFLINEAVKSSKSLLSFFYVEHEFKLKKIHLKIDGKNLLEQCNCFFEWNVTLILGIDKTEISNEVSAGGLRAISSMYEGK